MGPMDAWDGWEGRNFRLGSRVPPNPVDAFLRFSALSTLRMRPVVP